jgi:hypothetical protein
MAGTTCRPAVTMGEMAACEPDTLAYCAASALLKKVDTERYLAAREVSRHSCCRSPGVSTQRAEDYREE